MNLNALERQPGFVGIASALVETAPEYEEILENLLGRTVIAETLDHAIRMARAGENRFRIVTISGGHAMIALVLTMLCCIVLGMGVPTTANYCIMAATCAPILMNPQIGVPAMAAHFFVFYFGIVADITPPVALAAYAGSAIAKAPPMKTAFNATKLAIAAFIVPYIFAMNPAMLLVNVENPFQVVQIVLSALIGLFGVAASLNGFLYRPINFLFRLALVAGGLSMMIPGTLTDGLAFLILFAFEMILRFFTPIKQISFSRLLSISCINLLASSATVPSMVP